MRRGSLVVAMLLAQLSLAGDCVDGITPDCSDAAAQCGPDVDGAAPRDAATGSDVSATDSAPPNDASVTADAADADADASDASQ